MSSKHLEPSSQTQRRRRAHKRSRKGCSTCKQRHIRCDEMKPVCTNCLVRGTECFYASERDLSPSSATSATSPMGSRSSSPRLIASPALSPSPSLHRTSAPPADPFNRFPAAMPSRSREFLRHYAEYRQIAKDIVPHSDTTPSGDSPFMIPDDSVIHIHSIVAYAAMHIYLLTGSMEHVEETYLHHKIEAMRILNQRFSQAGQGSYFLCVNVNVITCMALAESGMGDRDASAAHIRGLFGYLHARRAEVEGIRYVELIQRFMLITGALISATRKSAKQPGRSGGELFRPTAPLYRVRAASDGPSGITPIYEFCSTASHAAAAAAREGGSPSRLSSPDPVSIPAPVWATAVYLLIHVIVEYMWNPIDPPEPNLILWLLDSPRHADPSADIQLWLWKTVLGAWALVAGSAFPAEDPSIDPSLSATDGSRVLLTWFDALMVRWKADPDLDLTRSEMAAEVVGRIAWLDEDEGRAFLRKMWGEAKRARDGRDMSSAEGRIEAYLEGLPILALRDAGSRASYIAGLRRASDQEE